VLPFSCLLYSINVGLQADLSHVIDDFLSVTAQCAPSILVTKPKFHFLLHLPMFIRRFGPAILYSTERYESFNHVFRLALIYSNRQAPSRDACHLFAEQEGVRHVVSGGYWRDPTTRKWANAGPSVLQYISEHPHQHHFLGFPDIKSNQAGKFLSTLMPVSNWYLLTGTANLPTHAKGARPSEIDLFIDWQETQAAQCLQDVMEVTAPATRFQRAVSVTAQHGDKSKVQLHVVVKHNDGYQIGKITEILVPFQQHVASHIVISILDFLPELHPRLRVPCIRYPVPEHKIVVSPSVCLFASWIMSQLIYRSQDVICVVNVQHDCVTSCCNSTRTVFEQQERLLSSRTKVLVNHTPTNAYVLNTHSLHNYQWILSAIPTSIRNQIRAPLITEHASLRLRAADLLRSKKAADIAPDPGNEADPPPFDRSNKTCRTAGKGKGKAKATSSLAKSTTAMVSSLIKFHPFSLFNFHRALQGSTYHRDGKLVLSLQFSDFISSRLWLVSPESLSHPHIRVCGMWSSGPLHIISGVNKLLLRGFFCRNLSRKWYRQLIIT